MLWSAGVSARIRVACTVVGIEIGIIGVLSRKGSVSVELVEVKVGDHVVKLTPSEAMTYRLHGDLPDDVIGMLDGLDRSGSSSAAPVAVAGVEGSVVVESGSLPSELPERVQRAMREIPHVPADQATYAVDPSGACEHQVFVALSIRTFGRPDQDAALVRSLVKKVALLFGDSFKIVWDDKEWSVGPEGRLQPLRATSAFHQCRYKPLAVWT